MTRDLLAPRSRPAPDRGSVLDTRATVFGLDVYSDLPLSLLQDASAAATGRRLEVSGRLAGEEAALAWPEDAELICDETEPDGTVCFRIEAHPEAGYLIWGPTSGAHLLSADGSRLQCAPGGAAEAVWQRLLIAQVLPFAALLHGLEVFHASAVVLAGHAVAFAGPSRAGKTSLALALCRRGASFLADDVLALEPVGEQLLAHPGTPVAGLDHAESQRLRDTPDADLADVAHDQVVAVNARERLVRVDGAAEPAPLAALFFLDRRPDGPSRPRFEPGVDTQTLLAATFNFVLATPRRLQGLLDVCALVAQRRVERVVVGPAVDASRLGAAIGRRLDTGR